MRVYTRACVRVLALACVTVFVILESQGGSSYGAGGGYFRSLYGARQIKVLLYETPFDPRLIGANLVGRVGGARGYAGDSV